jgi:MoaA/NifB/PqqE/SkfB family radical SAM enzyme
MWAKVGVTKKCNLQIVIYLRERKKKEEKEISHANIGRFTEYLKSNKSVATKF